MMWLCIPKTSSGLIRNTLRRFERLSSLSRWVLFSSHLLPWSAFQQDFVGNLSSWLLCPLANDDLLFMAQGDHRIDAHGAASGDVTGSHRNGEQNDAHSAKGQWIGRRNSIEQAGHQVREQKPGHSSGP